MLRRNPSLYEVNTALFLPRLSKKYGRPLTLSAVPEDEFRYLTGYGFDLVWLMGVWQRSPGARQRALSHPGLREEYGRVLPGWSEADVGGSPYAVYDYRLDRRFGEASELAGVKSRLNGLGLGLILDFVPNHLALDHQWTLTHPDRFVRGPKKDVKEHPGWFFSTKANVYLAHGRDPYFPPWDDTVQVNYFSAEMRRAMIEQLLRVAAVADGARCDMAMLALNSVFQQVWGGLVKNRLETEFWAEAITQVRAKHPDFIFLAEVYWGLESQLLELGFNYVYDKELYDKLRHANAGDIRGYLAGRKDVPPQAMTRFIENHDESRAVSAFGRERSLAAAAVISTLPGMRFFHDGQLIGRKTRVPVQLVSEPEEPVDNGLLEYYQRLLSLTKNAVFHDGRWAMVEIMPGATGDPGQDNLLAWVWQAPPRFKLVVINFSPRPSRACINLPPGTLTTHREVIFYDEMGAAPARATVDASGKWSVLVDLAPWQSAIYGISGET